MDTKTFRLALVLMISQLLAITCYGQLLMTKTGEASFFSETPLENISATNKQVGVILNAATGEIAVRMQQRAFHFPNKLMEEHFNENYMETGKFPLAVFTGKIKESIDFTKDGIYTVNADGILEMHGVKQNRRLKGQLVVAGGQVTLTTAFDVKLTDHRIEVPSLVVTKISEVIAVKTRFVLTPKKVS